LYIGDDHVNLSRKPQMFHSNVGPSGTGALIYTSGMNFLRFLLMLSLALWIGGLVFLPITAQISFTQLPSTHLAGIVVRGSLLALHWLGIIAGILFLLCSLIEGRVADGRTAPLRPSHIIVVVMLALTAISQFRIIPKMDSLLAATEDITQLPPGNSLRQQFDFLHATSTRIEEAVLLLGIVLLYLTTRRLTLSARA